uniref:Uncharacterized protein C11orf95 n=1 Tax=Anthurium amnicola TaxID=1678845 RepID=A0A1D1YDM2_9ARAE
MSPMGDYHGFDRGYRAGFGGERKQLEIVKGKEFSANQTYVTAHRPPRPRSPEPPFPRGKVGAAPPGGPGWGCFSDPEMKRRRRVASYKAYAVEGKVKSSLRRGFRWIKRKCSELVHGW